MLSPRQQLTAAPMASHANSAFALDAADGSPANAVYVDVNGNVGVGTTTPTSRLDVRGGPIVVENLGDQAELLWLASERSWVFRQEGVGSSTALKLQSMGGGGNKNFIVQTDGFMGVGTTSPQAKLDVRGDIRLGPTAHYLAPPADENLRHILGRVASNGALLLVAGFTSSRFTTGQYTINFNPDFAATPAVIVSVDHTNDGALVGMPAGTSAGSTSIRVATGGGTLIDRTFSFIAIGPR